MDKEHILKKANGVKDLTGMDVSERLWAAGLMPQFEKLRTSDKEMARYILEALKVNEDEIEKILH
ncbi:MAG: hypothetical protein JXQ90_00095 [Cyclobacteriaceae bacterium]